MAILLQLIHGIVDEALWSRDVVLAKGTGEAVRVKLHALKRIVRAGETISICRIRLLSNTTYLIRK